MNHFKKCCHVLNLKRAKPVADWLVSSSVFYNNEQPFTGVDTLIGQKKIAL